MRRQQTTVGDDTVSIVTIVDETHQGPVPTLVMLPSSSRDSLDFDDIAERFVHAGFRVLRPQPRQHGGQSRTDDRPDAARFSPRHCMCDRADGQRLDLRLRPCVRPMDRPLRGCGSSEPRAGRHPGRGGSEIPRSRPARRTGEMRRYVTTRPCAAGSLARRLLRPRPRSLILARQLASRGIQGPARRQRHETPQEDSVEIRGTRPFWISRRNTIPGARPRRAGIADASAPIVSRS